MYVYESYECTYVLARELCVHICVLMHGRMDARVYEFACVCVHVCMYACMYE